MLRHGSCVNDDKILIRSLRTVGRCDHYAHFFLDFVMPVYDWIYSHGRLYDDSLCICVGDPLVENFREIINKFFNCRIITKGLQGDIVGKSRQMVMGWEAHNRKILSLKLSDYVGFPIAYLSDFHEYVCGQFNVRAGTQDKFVLVHRKEVEEDRGGGRRNISNHAEVAEAMAQEAEMKGLQFVDAVLEDMDYAEQIKLFQDTSVLVAQHGASLCNVMLMRPGSTVVELHKDDKEEYRYRSLCNFFKIAHHSNIVCPLDGESTSVQGDINVPVAKLRKHIQQEMKRCWNDL